MSVNSLHQNGDDVLEFFFRNLKSREEIVTSQFAIDSCPSILAEVGDLLPGNQRISCPRPPETCVSRRRTVETLYIRLTFYSKPCILSI